MKISQKAKTIYEQSNGNLPSPLWVQRVVDLWDAIPEKNRAGIRLDDWVAGTGAPREETDVSFAMEANQDLVEGEFRGLASATEVKFTSGFVPTIIKKGAFADTIVEHRDRIKILWQHNVETWKAR